MLEAINYVAVIGMSIDYCVHMSEAYVEASATEREPRVKKMLAEMGVSVCVAQSGRTRTPTWRAPEVPFVACRVDSGHWLPLRLRC